MVGRAGRVLAWTGTRRAERLRAPPARSTAACTPTRATAVTMSCAPEVRIPRDYRQRAPPQARPRRLCVGIRRGLREFFRGSGEHQEAGEHSAVLVSSLSARGGRLPRACLIRGRRSLWLARGATVANLGINGDLASRRPGPRYHLACGPWRASKTHGVVTCSSRRRRSGRRPWSRRTPSAPPRSRLGAARRTRPR